MDVMPITVRRTPALISQADPDMLKMLLVCGEGSTVVDTGWPAGADVRGEFALYDTRRPYEVDCAVGQDRPTPLVDVHVPAVAAAVVAEPAAGS